MRSSEARAAADDMMSGPGAGALNPGALEHLRWVVAAFESAQADRLRAGEQIRAALRARVAESTGVAELAYARAWAEEQRAQRLMRDCIEAHPAWPWLAGVRGVGHTLAGRLLARLDVARAPHPSSFWAYCGLSTVPGATGGRVAQPRPRRGERSPYDREAKALCYLLGASFARQGGAYRRYLDEQLQRLERERPDWPGRRRQLTAQRKAVKLFLTHLWLVWRGALGMPLTRPHAVGDGQSPPPPSPWSMVEGAVRGGPLAPPVFSSERRR